MSEQKASAIDGDAPNTPLRDYFAAKAMQRFLHDVPPEGLNASHHFEQVSRRAYEVADAMLEARKPT